ncbi:flavin monoamine oxidase family protein [Streptomyces sp. NBC_01264]|uniref:flavin monoamine oxidase family protein n=1 Tax=Streptomyces sp. NBC_01264 TaxID=2903804 RepID=UPI002251C01A|nr:NAD(P)/FAD-dependent oxidoreductase [Streptomyces sp. NBC_01264]MCX4777461.1 FAD-dependent oxidoreductase [Streptomyces sp. NBC_01264]
MARTPLMHALRRLAAEHAAARQLGLPVAEVRGSSRRQLLGRAAALGLGAAVASAAVPPAGAHAVEAAIEKKPVAPARVAIVGAGISGLTAAITLKDAGVPFTLYEANPSRVGGRMWTQRSLWAYGQTSEIGGELIDTSHKKILELCRRFGLPVEDFLGGGPNGAEEVLWFNGTYYPRDQADEDFNAVHQALRRDLQESGEVSWNSSTPAGTALDNMTLYQWIETRIPGGHGSQLGRFIDVAYNVEYGADTQQQSALALVLLMGYQTNPGHFNVWGLSNERYHITGGNDQLPNAIGQALPAGSTVMGRELVAVRVAADGTQTLTFNDAGATRTVVADHTILCLPLPVLQRIDITGAGFDPLMKNLLSDARMGYCTKLNMQFTSRPWRGTGPWPGVSAGDCFTDSEVQQTWDTTKVQPGNGGILLQYGGGTLAGALTPATAFATDSDPYVRTLAGRMLTGIDAFFPGTKAAWTGKAQLSAWHRNPYALGAYSYWPTGYLHKYAKYEGTAQGRIHIGGEHCSYDFQGFMEGGATEGERAAKEVITALT